MLGSKLFEYQQNLVMVENLRVQNTKLTRSAELLDIQNTKLLAVIE